MNPTSPNVTLVGIPFDESSSFLRGPAEAPPKIREALHSPSANLATEAGRDLGAEDRFRDAGDLQLPTGAAAFGAIERGVAELLESGDRLLILGGDHAITLPSATAVAQHYGYGRVGMVHFDAHADTGPSSHGGVLIGHGNPMRRLIESGAIPGKNFVQVGLRGYWPPGDVFDWMREQGMRWHPMSEIEDRGFENVLDDAINEALDGPEYVYLSVDIDVLDPAYAPGTGTPEPGGITSSELLQAVRRIVGAVKLVAVDVVEVSPPYDGPGAITAEAAHRVVLEAISALAHKRV